MVNLFDLNVGVSASRMLADKPHRDGSLLSRNRSDVLRMSLPGDPTEDKVACRLSEYMDSFSNRKSHVTHMKMHIAQEMLKEVNSSHDPHNLVAKLMGLDTFVQSEADAALQRNYSRVCSRSHSEIPIRLWQKQNEFFHGINPNGCQEFYDVCQQPQKLPNKGRYEETINDKQMDLVRQKFVEAKRMSMDEKLRQSKQFHDALEVLSSNKDLFLKCLQEPSSMFYQQSVPPPSETKKITVLRPSNMPDGSKFAGSGNIDGKRMKNSAFLQVNELERIIGDSPPAGFKCNEIPTQPTQIVVLKPSPGRFHNFKAVSPQLDAQRILHVEDFFGDVEADENRRSREVAKAITQQMREKLGRHCRDETLISSVYSDDFVGDERSFNESEIEYADGNLSDSELLSPVSRHSLYSSSPFSRASYSPESSVCREAKRRLSERWAMMASNRNCQKPKHVQRNSSTLGEMLALSEASNPGSTGDGCSPGEPKYSDTFLISGLRQDRDVDNSPRNLTRSKSVPVSCTEFGARLNTGSSVSDKPKVVAPNEDTRARHVKSSFKGKVSRLFFSRNRKSGQDKSLESETTSEIHTLPGEICGDGTERLSDKGPRHLSPCPQEPSLNSPYCSLIGLQDLTSPVTSLAVGKPIAPRNQGGNQDQSSSISVLDQPFEEDTMAANPFPHFVKSIQNGIGSWHNSIGSNLIDKSPPIGSIARTLSWDDAPADTASSYLATEILNVQGADQDKQQWYSFIKILLSVAGFHGDLQSNSFFRRWHSPESPLDPSLRDKYIQDKEIHHEAKQRQLRSTQKLVFDCVNAALVDIAGFAGYGAYFGQQVIPCLVGNQHILENESSKLMDEVWARMNALFSDKIRCLSEDCGDDNSLGVGRVVRKEVVGKGWIDLLRLEMDSLGKAVEENLLAELVHEAVVELTGRA